MNFIGRKTELGELHKLKNKNSASLIVVHGRRRIGKSTLLAEFGRSFESFYEFQGLGPREYQTNQQQLDNFALMLKSFFGLPGFKFADWSEAFETLAELSKSQNCLIILDEISWMAQHDADFSGKLKIAWDTRFKKNPKVILALCGSVSSWIEKNILGDTDFVGRISWSQNLSPLKISDCNGFWGKRSSRISSHEKLTFLSVTGCIPKYLEEMIVTDHATDNIARLCFRPTGYLYQDFEKIFNDVFNKRSLIYKNILSHLVNEKLDAASLATKMGQYQSGDLTEYLQDMCHAGFVARDYSWDFSGQRTKLSRYRIKDNYLRFYLKYIDPRKEQIEKGIFNRKMSSLDTLLAWDAIRGLQFENLVLDNTLDIIDALGIEHKNIIQYGSFFQTQTKKRQGCQIDLMILDKYQTVYLCEIKFKREIGREVINDVQEKIKRLERPKYISVRPILIYSGELSTALLQDDFFDKTFDVGSLLS